MSDKHSTEEVYDNEMAPLVSQLIAIARRANIPLVVSAGMLCRVDDNGHGDEDSALSPTTCTTKITPDYVDPMLKGMVNRHNLAVGVVRGHSGFDHAAALVISRYHDV